MDFWIATIVLTAIGCGTGIVITVIDKLFSGKHKRYQEQLRLSEERLRQLEAQLVEAHRQNDLLQKQVEWHAKLLEAQDRIVKQLGPGEGAVSRS
jgi:hypothetical protein